MDLSSSVPNPGGSWLSQLDGTHWLEYLSTILHSVVSVVHMMHNKRESVLIHCSDGWDRTPQITSLAQILLDGYYRTIEGFMVLIEKEWLLFGHKFGDRLGFNFTDTSFKEAERSPVFFQFLDAVWQVMQQFPWTFEFSEDLLLVIGEHCISGRFGTFLFNFDSERRKEKLAERTPSLWTFILNNRKDYLNPFYKSNSESEVLFPLTNVSSLQFWSNHYLRFLKPSQTRGPKAYIQLGNELKDKLLNLEEENKKLEKKREELLIKLKELEKDQGIRRRSGSLFGNETPSIVVNGNTNGNPKKEEDVGKSDLESEWTPIDESQSHPLQDNEVATQC